MRLRHLLVLTLGCVASWCSAAAIAHAQPSLPPVQVPPISARPVLGDFAARAERLFDAIVHDDPKLASEVFFPRAAFLQVKAIPDPGRYYDKLYARFEQDVHALHRTIAVEARGSAREQNKDAHFERFELVKRGGHVKPGEEGNHLPYWAARHCFLHYREGGRARKFEVRVLITWEQRWYVIHLSEFH